MTRSRRLVSRLGRRQTAPALWLKVLALFLAPWLSPATAATITLNPGCSLAKAIDSANDDHLVDLDCTVGSGADTIVLVDDIDLIVVNNSPLHLGNNGLPVIRTDITIEGGGHVIRRVSAADFRLFLVRSDGSLTLRDVILEDGNEGAGACIFVYGGTLELQRGVVRDCSGSRGPGIYNNAGTVLVNESLFQANLAMPPEGENCNGGAIASYGGELTVTNSTFYDNWAFVSGAYGGAVSHTGGMLTIENSTFSRNVASTRGGAVSVQDLYGFPAATARITHSTFRGNISASGGGISRTAGEVTLKGSVLHNNAGGNCDGVILDGGNNFGCTGGPAVTDLDTTLSYNGGPTPTHALLSGSNAIDAANGCGLGTDQRGAGRMTACDAGAFERIGCSMFEMSNESIDFPVSWSTCHTAILGPDFAVQDTGSVDLEAGYLATLYSGFTVEDGGILQITINPSLLP